MIGTTKSPLGRTERLDENGRRGVMAAATIGALLRERREALGASLAEVEAATKIRQKYLSALEADEWQALPGEVVGRGFLRNYAAYLGLEPTEIIDRRRAIADPSLSNALAPTSAGSELPPMRQVDYRPKDVGLREEPESLEERTPPRLGPLLGVIGAIAALLLLWWGISRFGGSALEGIAAAAGGVSDRVSGWFAAGPSATATPSLAVLANNPVATSTSVFDSGANGAAGQATADPLAALPNRGEPAAVVDNAALGTDAAAATATAAAALAPPVAAATPAAQAPVVQPTPIPPSPTPAPPTPTPIPPTPAPQAVTVNTQANLRAQPSTDANIVGAAQPNDQVRLIGQSPDGQWYLLDSGAWIFAQLVAAPAAAVAVVDPASVTAPVTVALPTATPPGAPAEVAAPAQPAAPAAACADARSVITAPGQGQTVTGVIAIAGNATHEAFASYKLEAGTPGAALAFVGSGNSPISGGQLGSVDTAAFANGPLLIRLTVIDQSGNYPAPCDVTVTAQN